MKLYVESSAVLAWLFGENAGGTVRHILSGAELVMSSDLTLVECERVIIRSEKVGGVTEAHAADLRATLHQAVAHWATFAMKFWKGHEDPSRESQSLRWMLFTWRALFYCGPLSRILRC